MGLTLATLDTVIGLTIARHNTIQRDEILTTMLTIFLITRSIRQSTLVFTFIIMDKNSRDVDTIDDDELLQRCLKGEDDK